MLQVLPDFEQKLYIQKIYFGGIWLPNIIPY